MNKSGYKIFVTVPESYTQILLEAMSEAGAGHIGQYSHCAFISTGIGWYMPEDGTKPFVGKVGVLNSRPENKIEMICAKAKLVRVIKAIRAIHPYETPVIDIIEIVSFP